MMRKLSVLIGIVLFALTSSNAAVAQTPSTVDEIPGIQESVFRGFVNDDVMGDAAALIKTGVIGTPGPGGARKDLPDLSGVSFLAGEIQRYDTSKHAASGFDVWDSTIRSYLEEYSPDRAGIDVFDVDLGDRSKRYTATDEFDDGQHVDIVVVIAQRGAFMYLTFSSVIDAGALGVATEFTQALMDNDAGDGDVAFDEDGTSTGGLWDKFPDPDDALVRSLKTSDAQVYAATGGDANPRP